MVCVAILLCVVPTVVALLGGQDYLRTGINLAAKPFRAAINFASDGIDGYREYFKGVDELIRDNEALRAELEKYCEENGKAALHNLLKEKDNILEMEIMNTLGNLYARRWKANPERQLAFTLPEISLR